MASPVRFPEREEEAKKASFNPDGTPIESSKDKFWRKMKEQPLVPVGSLLTCGALVVASHHLRTGNRGQFQKALRWRVGLQGLTVVAAVAGTFYYGSGGTAPRSDPISSHPSSNSSTSASSPLDSIASVPGRPPTVHQASKAEERKKVDRAQLQERFREAEQRQEADEKRQAEEALLRPGGEGGRTRPIIGRDGRDRSV